MTLPTPLFDAHGVRFRLAEKLGSGGEGSVYLLAEADRQVAKIYHRPLSEEQQAKLSCMVSCCNDTLMSIAAWPRSVLHAGRRGPICGFVMPRVIEYQPVHIAYGPAQRKMRFPQANWSFLIRVARNIAAAFDVIHAHGHLIGDVNQGNVLVARNALVHLIDCDSFQVSAGGACYCCEVGVAHFTPPELQEKSSFRGLQRTLQHDLFGLAVLLFHVLFMGRHPFAGVYAGPEDMPIERAIKEHRYVFGSNAVAAQMARPPGSVGPELVTPQLRSLFEAAFGTASAHEPRPPANMWVRELDTLGQALQVCRSDGVHHYLDQLPACPWCEHEEREGHTFFVTAIALTVLNEPAGFDLNAAWRKIEACRSLVPSLPVNPASFAVERQPLPSSLNVHLAISLCVYILFIVLLIGLAGRAPPVAFVWVFVGAGLIQSVRRRNPVMLERARRKRALQAAQERWNAVEQRWGLLSGAQDLQTTMAALARAQREYRSLDVSQANALHRLRNNARQHQLERFLAQFHLESASLAGLGPARLAMLASFGIETAADIESRRLAGIGGLPPAVCAALLEWRSQLASRFRFDPTRACDPTELRTLEQRFVRRRAELAAALSAGPQELERTIARHEPQRRAYLATAREAARALAQARADAA